MAASPQSPKSAVLSPVKLTESPSQTQRGNLTGTPRKVKDSVADIYNLIQKWNRLHADGASLLRKISDDLPQRLEEEKSGQIWEALHKKCCLMEGIKSRQVEIVESFETIQKHFQALEKLTKNSSASEPIFLTWPISQYVLLSEQVLLAFKQQLATNVYIAENIALSECREAEALVSLWIHQTYLEPVINFLVEAALRETGFS